MTAPTHGPDRTGDLHPGGDRPVRDQHGHPLPGQDAPVTLSAEQVDQGLLALPGWVREGDVLVRRVPVEPASREGLREGARKAAEPRPVGFAEEDGGIAIRLGRGAGGIVPADLEAAARVDTVLSGSGTDRGSTR